MGAGAYAVDAATGTVRWHNALDQSHALTFVGPALRDGLLYVGGMDSGGHGTLYALDVATGVRRWEIPRFSHLSPSVV